MSLLDEKVVIVTGGGGGLGEAQARYFVAEGARVLVTDIDAKRARAVAEALGPSAAWLAHDVTDEGQWNDAVALVLQRFGRLDGLINNAGVSSFGSVEQVEPAELERVFNINVTSVLIGIRAVAASMKERGGAIVNIASGAALRGSRDLAAYSTSKWAVRGLSRCAAADLVKYKIRVNCIVPGVTETPMTRKDPKFIPSVLPTIPLGRVGSPDDIAPLAALLVSDRCSFAIGAEFVLDGGRAALGVS